MRGAGDVGKNAAFWVCERRMVPGRAWSIPRDSRRAFAAPRSSAPDTWRSGRRPPPPARPQNLFQETTHDELIYKN